MAAGAGARMPPVLELLSLADRVAGECILQYRCEGCRVHSSVAYVTKHSGIHRRCRSERCSALHRHCKRNRLSTNGRNLVGAGFFYRVLQTPQKTPVSRRNRCMGRNDNAESSMYNERSNFAIDTVDTAQPFATQQQRATKGRHISMI